MNLTTFLKRNPYLFASILLTITVMVNTFIACLVDSSQFVPFFIVSDILMGFAAIITFIGGMENYKHYADRTERASYCNACGDDL